MCVVRIEKMPKLQTACTTPSPKAWSSPPRPPRSPRPAKHPSASSSATTPSTARLRRRRRVRAPGHDLQSTVPPTASTPNPRITAKSRSGPRRLLRPPPLHPLLPLRPHVRRRHGRLRPRHPEPRQLLRHRPQRPRADVPRRPRPTLTANSAACASTPARSAPSPPGTYRYKTRPWEMNHVGTICTHCGDGCKTTLGVTQHLRWLRDRPRRQPRQIRHQRRLPLQQGPLRFDFANNETRITQPLVRQPNGELKPVSWETAFDHVGKKLRELRDTRGGKSIGVIGSTAPLTKRPTSSRSSPAPSSAPTTSTTIALPTTSPSPRPSLEPPAAPHPSTTPSPRPPSCSSAATHRSGPRHRVEHPHQRPQQPRPPLRCQLRRDQAPPPGQVLPPRRSLRLQRPHRLPRRQQGLSHRSRRRHQRTHDLRRSPQG